MRSTRGPRAASMLMVLAIAGASMAAPAIAGPRLSVGPTRIVAAGPGDLARAWEMSIFVTADQPGAVALTPRDAIIDPAGQWRDADFGTTPHSLASAMTVAPSSFPVEVSADGTPQQFTATVRFDPAAVREPLFGSIVATFVPSASATGADVSVRIAVQTQVLVAPDAAGLSTLPQAGLGLVLGKLILRQERPWTPIDAAFPNIPFLVNHGPVSVESQGANVGSVPLDVRTTYEFRRLNVLDLLFGRTQDRPPIFVVRRPPKLALPEQTITDSTSSLVRTDDGLSIDALPLIGFVRVTARIEGGLSGVEATPAELSRTVLVFPWSEATFLFVVWVFQREWRHRKGRKVHAGEGPAPRTLRARIKDRISPPKSL